MKQYFTAIIEDDPGYAGYLEQCLARYGAEHDCTFQIRSFSRAEAFLTDSRIVDDMVFMDVDLGEGWTPPGRCGSAGAWPCCFSSPICLSMPRTAMK